MKIEMYLSNVKFSDSQSIQNIVGNSPYGMFYGSPNWLPTGYTDKIDLEATSKIYEYITDNGISDNFLLNSTLDGDPLVFRFNTLHIQAGHVFRPTVRCKGLYIVVDNLILNGSISMTQRGCVAEGRHILINPLSSQINYYKPDDAYITGIVTNRKWTPWHIDAYGGIGGLRGSSVFGGVGWGESSTFSSGGGGAGANRGGTKSGNGSAGTSFSGGSGGGGYNYGSPYGGDGAPNGGAGGNGVRATSGSPATRAGGGIGNPNGAGSGMSAASQSGTGGSIILIIKNFLSIGPAGTIQANGYSQQDNFPAAHPYGWANCPGGASGGGNISIYYKNPGIYTELKQNISKIVALGGTNNNAIWGTGGQGNRVNHGNGGNGMIRLINY